MRCLRWSFVATYIKRVRYACNLHGSPTRSTQRGAGIPPCLECRLARILEIKTPQSCTFNPHVMQISDHLSPHPGLQCLRDREVRFLSRRADLYISGGDICGSHRRTRCSKLPTTSRWNPSAHRSLASMLHHHDPGRLGLQHCASTFSQRQRFPEGRGIMPPLSHGVII